MATVGEATDHLPDISSRFSGATTLETMANTYTQIIFHVVFSTKCRMPCIHESRREELYRYIWGIHEKLNCHLYRIGGVADHIHLLTSMRSTTTLAKYVEEVKTGSTSWIRRFGIYPEWPGWQDGYGGFTLSFAEKDGVIEYIKAQPEHHRTISFTEELEILLKQAGVKYDPRYLE